MLNTPFDLLRIGQGLPVATTLTEFTFLLKQNRCVVVEAPPGTGKTTLIPPAVANVVNADPDTPRTRKVLVTAPRRVAVISAARRLRQLHSGSPSDIGFSVRGQSEPGARIQFVTPGVLLRMLMSDPSLDDVSAVVLDEVHERNLDTDLALGMLAELQQLRSDLTVVAMSATVDAARFARLLGAEVHSVSAPLHPLDIRYAPGPARMDARGVSSEFLSWIATCASTAFADSDGSVLVFVPGRREIDEVGRQLSAPWVAVHGGLDAAEQSRIVNDSSQRRIVLATSIAESSVTVAGVRTVVDSCLSRVPRRDNNRGMSGLVTVSAAQSSMDQRAGRAARLGPGTALRLCQPHEYRSAPEYPAPEILTSDLTQAALNLACWGTPRGEGLPLLDQPPAAALSAAEEALHTIGAVTAEGTATAYGSTLARIPADPRFAHALLRVGEEAAPVLAELAVGTQANLAAAQPTSRVRAETRRFQSLARRYSSAASADAGHGTNAKPSTDAGHSGSSDTSAAVQHTPASPAAVVALALPGLVAMQVDTDNHVYLTASGTRARVIDPTLRGHPWLAIAEVSRGTNQQGLPIIRRAVPTNFDELSEWITVEEDTTVDIVDGLIRARTVSRCGAIELTSTPCPVPAESVEPALSAHLAKHGLTHVRFSESAQRLRERMAFIRHHDETWPDVSDAGLVARADEWLAGYTTRLADGMSLAQVDMEQALTALMPWPQAATLDTDVPEALTVPSGRKISISYADSQPTVRVKLQECFGYTDSPRVLGVKIRFELLSPAQRPLAITDDLAGFWDGAYQHVRADMRGRYPKHPWPEDPRTAVATAGTKKQMKR